MLATTLVYLPALGHPFVYDDLTAVVGRPLAGWYVLFTPRALTLLSYGLDRAIGDLRPIVFHTTNLALHLANVLLWRRLVRGWSPDRPQLALGAALLFAVHPLFGEAVRYASARGGVLCLTFMLLATLVRRRSGLAGLAALALLACALLSKETAALLPLAWLLEDQWLEPDPVVRARRLRRFHLPLLAVVAALGGARVLLFTQLEGGTLYDYPAHLARQVVVFWTYLELALLPIGLAIWHPPVRVSVVSVVLAVAGLAALLAGLVALRRRAPLASFGLAWLLLFLAPSSLMPLREMLSEHRVYEAAPGLTLLAAVGLAALPKIGRLVTLALALALATATVVRGYTWASPERLWSEAVERAPLYWAPRYALGDARRTAGDCPGAIDAYRSALALAPSEARIHVNLGVCLEEIGDLYGAEQAFRQALALDPGFAPAQHDLDALLAP